MVAKNKEVKTFDNREYILEKLVDLDREISVVITRYSKNNYEIYEPIENLHEQQILRYSTIPAKINSDLFEKSQGWAKLISERLEYVGTLCVEFFIDPDQSGGYYNFEFNCIGSWAMLLG